MSCAVVSSNGETIPLRCRTLVYHIGALLDERSDPPQDFMEFHRNAAIEVNTSTLQTDGVIYTPHYTSFFKESLSSIVLEMKQQQHDPFRFDEFCRVSLGQIARGLKHLHKKGLYPQDLTADTILFSCDRKFLAITGCPGGSLSECLQRLGGLFSFVLSSDPDNYRQTLKCDDKKIAEDIIDKLQNCVIDVDDILAHPFFWSDLQKISFVCDAFDSIKKEDAESKRTRAAIDEDPLGIVASDWIRKLKIIETEKAEILAIKGAPKQICLEIIQNKAQEVAEIISVHARCQSPDKPFPTLEQLVKKRIAEKWPETDSSLLQGVHQHFKGNDLQMFKIPENAFILLRKKESYNKESLYDLLRFFRNCKAHYWEQKKNLKICFQTYPAGFWKFFSRRYPELLLFLYNKKSSISFFDAYKHYTSDMEYIPPM